MPSPSRQIKRLYKLPAKILIAFIAVYQYLISPLIGPRCRFYPSCSSYTREALTTHRLIPAIRLSTKRILRCHPRSQGGVDPVPSVKPLSPTSTDTRHA